MREGPQLGIPYIDVGTRHQVANASSAKGSACRCLESDEDEEAKESREVEGTDQEKEAQEDTGEDEKDKEGAAIEAARLGIRTSPLLA